MIKELTIKNFRSIREATLELGRFTVLTGANNSGKSSVLYALQVLKNVVTNPNRSVDELLNLGFLNLGGLENASFINNLNKEFREIGISVVAHKKRYKTQVGIGLRKETNRFTINGESPFSFEKSIVVSFPYPLNTITSITDKEKNFEAKWNGILPVEIVDKIHQPDTLSSNAIIKEVKQQFTLPFQYLSATDVTPTQRGFTKPIFNTTPLNGHIFTEDEVATLLAIDKDVQSKVAFYFEKITGKRFNISIQPGMGFFYMQVREPDSTFATELVNQGMGMNQIVFLLAKILYDKNRLICIDEPEIHLHPTLIEQFVKVLVEIAEKENKQFIFSTHSEHWLLSMLAEVNDGKLTAEHLKVYYLQKEEQETTIEQQKVMPNGQLEGGLKNFMEAQMRLAERFFDATTA